MKREIPTDMRTVPRSHYSSNEDTANGLFNAEPAANKRPFTPMQALMETAPGDEPDVSQMELLALRDVIADAIDRLGVRHRWVFEQNVIHRIPVRTLGEMMGLGKSYVWILVQEAKEALRADLQDHPAIAAYLTRHEETE